MSLSQSKFRSRSFIFLFGLGSVGALLLGLWGAGRVFALPTAPKPQDRFIVRAVAVGLAREHLSRHPLDNEISRRWLTNYLKSLDRLKVYFTAADVDEFMTRRDQLDEMAQAGDSSFAYAVFQRYLQRVDERVKLVDELLNVEHDFSVEEEMNNDPDKAEYPRDAAEVRDAWRKRVKYELLAQKYDKIEGAAAKEKISKKYHGIVKRLRQTDDNDLLEWYLTELTTAFDPHTSYMSPATLENFEISMKLELEGIGAELQLQEDGSTEVKRIVSGGAADKDGRLKAKDKVIGVGEGEAGEIIDVSDMKLNDIVKHIRGPQGTVVRLKVSVAGEAEPKIYNIVRAQIELTDSEARSQILEDGRKSDGTPYKVGVIDLPTFYMDMTASREGQQNFRSTTRDAAKLLRDFNEKKVDVVVVDLRRNPGGSLTEAINFTGLFIESGPVVQVKDSDGRVQQYDDPDRSMLWRGPLVVLVSKLSASASEIFAGAIQDYQRGLIVGDTSTHGKGTVQTVADLGQKLFAGLRNAPQMGALKVTISQFYRPNGESTQNRGVLSDVVLPSVISHAELGESSLDYALKFDQVRPTEYNKANMVDKPIVEQLRAFSETRRKDSEDFQKVLRRIARLEEYNQRKRVSLNEQKFLADREEYNADKEEEDEEDSRDRPVVKRDYYFNEALAVTLDYVRFLEQPQAAALGQTSLKSPPQP